MNLLLLKGEAGCLVFGLVHLSVIWGPRRRFREESSPWVLKGGMCWICDSRMLDQRWTFDLTVQRAGLVDHDQAVAPRTSRKMGQPCGLTAQEIFLLPDQACHLGTFVSAARVPAFQTVRAIAANYPR